MDDRQVPDVGNAAEGEETETVPWIEEMSGNRRIIHANKSSRPPITDARAFELARTLSQAPVFRLYLKVTHLSPTSEGTKELAASLATANIQNIMLEFGRSSTDKCTQTLEVLLAALKRNKTLSSLCLVRCGTLGDELLAFLESQPPKLTKIALNDCDLANPCDPRLFRCIGRALGDGYLTNFSFQNHICSIDFSSFRCVKLRVNDVESSKKWIQDLLADCSTFRRVSLSQWTPLDSVMHCSIETLSLDDLRCNLEVAHSLDSNLRSRAETLKELELHFLSMNVDCWQVVIPGITACHSLSSLEVRACMESVAAKGALIGRVLRTCPHITALSFVEDLRIVDVHVFLEDLRSNRTLKSLSLGLIPIGTVDALVDCLRYNPSLETIDLSHNDILDLTPLFRTLVDRPTPTDLFLEGNRCDHLGWNTLSEALERGAQLRKLRLDVNPCDHDDGLACIRFIRGLECQPHLKEFVLLWKWPGTSESDAVPTGDVLECLIRTIGSLRFLEKLSFVWDELILDWGDWKDALMASVKKNESLLDIIVDGVEDEDFESRLKFYNLRNRVNRTLECSARGLWGDILLQLDKWPERSVGISNVFLAFKTHPKLSENAGRSSSNRSVKKKRIIPRD